MTLSEDAGEFAEALGRLHAEILGIDENLPSREVKQRAKNAVESEIRSAIRRREKR